MLQTLKQNQSTAAFRRIFFWLLDQATGTIGQTGKTPAVRVGKNDGSNAAAAGVVTEVDSVNLPGLYYYEAALAEVDTLGTLVLLITEASSVTRRIHVTITEVGPTPGSPAAGTIMGALGDVQGTGFVKDTDSLVNAQAKAAAALAAYDPPTRAEATADKAAIIAEVDANEVKIDAVPTVAEIDTQLSATHGSGTWEDLAGPGEGANVVTITVEDSVSSIPIPAVQIQIRNAAETVLLATQETDVNGDAGFLLDDGTYKVRLRKLGSYTFSNPETLVVSGATSQTYQGVLFDPGTPASPDTCIVFGWERDARDVGLTVSVKAEIVGDANFLKSNPHIVSTVIETASDAGSDGYWTLMLLQSGEFETGNRTVEYKITIDGREIGTVKIPSQTTRALKDLIVS